MNPVSPKSGDAPARRPSLYDALIVGGGPAGLSAALVLGRACRDVLLCDAGQPRNAASRAVHGFLTRDGVTPEELRRLARAQLAAYDNVTIRDDLVTGARQEGGHFALTLGSGDEVRGRRLLIATGVIDELPAIAGLRALWGRSIFPCPYCDGWEVRGKRLAVYGPLPDVTSLGRALTGWSRRVTIITNGGEEACTRDDAAATFAPSGVDVVCGPVRRFAEADDGTTTIHLADGRSLSADAVFVEAGQRQRTPLIEALGCVLNERGRALTNDLESTNVPGLFVAGDASAGVELTIVAAAEGATAAFAINRSLVREAFERHEPLPTVPDVAAEPSPAGGATAIRT